jgi:2'-5' RNA ligase
MDEKIRAFIAIEIPNIETIDNIVQFQSDLQKSVGPLKLVDRSIMHCTLQFLGDISLETAEALYNFLETEINPVHFGDEPQSGFIRGIGDFNKRVYFVKVEGVVELLEKLADQVLEKTKEFPEIKQEDKGFEAHITVARAKDRPGYRRPTGGMPYSELKNRYNEFEFGPWNLEKVVLKKSVLTPKGPIYTNLKF